MNSNGWHGVDLDGSLATEIVPFDPRQIGDPVPDMVYRVRVWLARGEEVRIVTARVASTSCTWVEREQTTALIQDWTEMHLGARLMVTSEKDMDMMDLWDDRVVTVEKNTGRILTRL